MKDTRKETYEEQLKNIQSSFCVDENKAKEIRSIVLHYLDSCGYFEGDYNIHGFKRPDDWILYCERDFGHWLLDLALQYNMEHGKEYEAILIEDRHIGENPNYEQIKEGLQKLNNLD